MSEKFIRDKSNPGAVINTDNEALRAYKLQKAKTKELDTLKSDVSELKIMMKLILEKLK